MPSSLFGSDRGGNSILSAIEQVRSMGVPQAVYERMYGTDPRFRQFADSVRGKTPEQAFSENGLDFGQVRSLIGGYGNTAGPVVHSK